jgi:hypothetical protein
MAEIHLNLTENENRSEGGEGVASWLGLGIALEDAQCIFYSFVSIAAHTVNNKGQIKMGSLLFSPVFNLGRQD